MRAYPVVGGVGGGEFRGVVANEELKLIDADLHDNGRLFVRNAAGLTGIIAAGDAGHPTIREWSKRKDGEPRVQTRFDGKRAAFIVFPMGAGARAGSTPRRQRLENPCALTINYEPKGGLRVVTN